MNRPEGLRPSVKENNVREKRVYVSVRMTFVVEVPPGAEFGPLAPECGPLRLVDAAGNVVGAAREADYYEAQPWPEAGDVWRFGGETFRVAAVADSLCRLESLDRPGVVADRWDDSFRGGVMVERGGRRVPE